MTPKHNLAKSAKIQAIVLISVGFVLIFTILTSLILYTVYDRSLVDFIQSIRREEPTPAPIPEVNPAELAQSTATKQYKEGLWILSDSTLHAMCETDTNIAKRSYYADMLTSNNYKDKIFKNASTASGEEISIVDFVTKHTPKYLLLHFPKATMTLDKTYTEKFYTSIVDLILKNSPNTTVIISGPLPIDTNGETDLQTMNTDLGEMAGKLNKSGKSVYYLISPYDTAFTDENGILLKELQNENGTLSVHGCTIYYNNHILRHPVPADNSK